MLDKSGLTPNTEIAAGEVSHLPADGSWASARSSLTALMRGAAAAHLEDICCWPGCENPRLGGGKPLAICELHATEVFLAVRQGWHELRTRSMRALEGRPSARNGGGFIYYAQADSRIKIGHTKDVHRRMRAYPPDTRLLAVHPGTRAEERDLHALFSTYRVAGREWYSPAPMLLRHIERVVAEHGKPKPFAAVPRKAPAVHRPR